MKKNNNKNKTNEIRSILKDLNNQNIVNTDNRK